MREKMRKFMTGRYGVDQLSRFLLLLAVIVSLFSLFFIRNILSVVSLILLLLCNYRMLSRNFNRRYRENNIYLSIKNRIGTGFRKQKYRTEQRKVFHIYRCPKCRQKIRIPRGKGRIRISCPKCRTEFIKKS